MRKCLSIVALLSVLVMPALTQAEVVTITIDGTDAIYLAGRTDLTIPAPNTVWTGGLVRGSGQGLLETLPPTFEIMPGTTITTVTPATGLVSYASTVGTGLLNPEGIGFPGLANIGAFGGISAYFGSRAGLVGVFLTDDVPASSPPARIDFTTAGIDFTSISPEIGQVFHIGDGQTSTGTLQQFVAPANATRFAIGIADANNGAGAPGLYNDNDGSFQITLNIPLIPEPASFALLGLGGLMLLARRQV